jgi:hypothetical protein
MFLGERKPFFLHLDDTPLSSRYFLKFFKKKAISPKHKNTIPSDKLKKIITDIGRGQKVNIKRLAYDGTPEDKPVSVKIVDIREDHFSGKVVNVERSIKQAENDSLVYVKGGGGTIEFFYNDGDIISIEEDIDQSVIETRNVQEVKEILEALDVNEDIILSYYDDSEGGVINGVGVLLEKDLETMDFKVKFTMINEIELNTPREIILNLNNDKIVDLEVVI